MNSDLGAVENQIFLTVVKFLAFPIALMAGYIFLKTHFEAKKYRDSGMGEIDQMNGFEFEKYLEVFFKSTGFKVLRTQYRGDFGADIILSKHGEKIAVQAKRHSRRIGIKAVQEVIGSLAKYNCSRAMVVTNSTFTDQAKELARVNKVELWDRPRLQRELLKVQK